MTLVDSTLPSDDLVAFLSELENNWLHDPALVTLLSVGASNCVPVSPPLKTRTNKPRRYRRHELINVREEIAELQSQLQIAHKKAEFRESLNSDPFKLQIGLEASFLAREDSEATSQ